MRIYEFFKSYLGNYSVHKKYKFDTLQTLTVLCRCDAARQNQHLTHFLLVRLNFLPFQQLNQNPRHLL